MVIEGQDSGAAPETQGSAPAEAAPAPAETPAEGGAPQDDAVGAAAAAKPVVAAPYQVNPTFKVRHMEKKFEDWLLPHIKDAETEKKARELHEKAHGLEFVKADRERLSGELQAFKQREQQEYLPTVQAARQFAHFRQQGNLGAAFQAVGLDPKEVFQWAYNYANQPPEARAAMDRANGTEMQAWQIQQQQEMQQQQAMSQAAEFKSREYDMIMQYDSQVSSAAAEFDLQHGPGAFHEQIKRVGIYHWNTSGRDISVKEAVGEVMRLIGRAAPAQPQVQPGMQPQAVAPQTQQPGATPQAPASKPVIPSLQGKGGASPVKRVFSSLEDIAKHRKALVEQDQVAG